MSKDILVRIDNLPGTTLSTSEPNRGTPDTVIQQYPVKYVDNAAAIVVETAPIHIALKNGTINAFQAMLITNCAVAGPEDVTVDIQKGSEAGGYVTILDAVITFTSADADRAIKAASLAVTSYLEGDSFVVITTNANATDAQGLVAILSLREQPS